MRAFAISLCVLLGACVNGLAAADEPLAGVAECPREPNTYPGPYVEREETARAIAQAIIEARESPDQQARYELPMQDEGDHWIAFQMPLPLNSRIRGGGGLQMRIAKCDGAVSGVSFQR